MNKLLAAHGLAVVDVEEIPTHGGSLRVYATHSAASDKEESRRVPALLQREEEAGICDEEAYRDFSGRVKR